VSFGLLVLLSVGCGEDERLFNVFDAPPPVVEVPCTDTQSWREIEAPVARGLGDLWGASVRELWAVGAVGTILRFDGERWMDATPNLTMVDLHAIHGSSNHEIWAVGRGGVALHWNGEAWSRVETGTSSDLIGVWSLSPQDAWIVGRDGARRFDGNAFSRPSGAPEEPLNGIWASGASDVWMVSDVAFHHFDGARFTRTEIAQAGLLASIWGVSKDRVWAIGHSTANVPGFAELEEGQWGFDAAPPRAIFFTIWSLDGNEIFVGANDSSIFRRSKGEWCREHLGSIGATNSFFAFDTSRIWAVGAKKGPTDQGLPILLERTR
jgi:hypothetical protein